MEKGQTYLELDFVVDPLQPTIDILTAELSGLGFESFVETDRGLLAYVPRDDFEESRFSDVYIFSNPEFEITWSKREIAQKNWNAEWEKGFYPISINDTCYVRAPFHEPENVPYEIIIEPKMSFGTGHHETTHMMLAFLLELDLENKAVLDMGCGTGVLAIMAEKRGAKAIDAIDIDIWSYTNTLENIQRNNCGLIKAFEGDSTLLKGRKYDVVLANINRNVLLEDIPIYAACLNLEGTLVMSGFYDTDLPMITKKCGEHALNFKKNLERNNWVAAKYVF